jgi:hypothetical protein
MWTIIVLLGECAALSNKSTQVKNKQGKLQSPEEA